MTTRLLVTGASGFVGGAFCRRFADRDDLEIHGLGRRPSLLPHYHQADLTRPLEWNGTPDIVIHAAARSSPWGSLREFRRQNVLATRHVVDFCRSRGVRRLVYLSSSSVFYRPCDQFDLTEESPIGPDFVNAYARTKFEGEELVRDFPGESVILRPRAVFGPGDTVLFPRLVRAARQGRMVAITRPDPPATGDLIYIDSLCDYMLRAALDPGVSGDFNLTNDQPVPIQQFIADIFARLDLPPVRKGIPLRRAMRIAAALEAIHKVLLPHREPPITRFGVGVLGFSKTFDVSRSIDVLGPPSVSLEEGIEAFVRWQKSEWESP